MRSCPRRLPRHPARPAGLLALSLLLSGTALAPALGQTGWVDPPARGAGPAQAPATEAPAAPKADAETARSARSAAQPSAEAPQAAPRRQARQAAAETRAERPAPRSARHRRAARRLAQTPPLAPPMAPPAAAQPAAPGMADWAGAAQALTARYLDTISAPGPRMVSEAPRFYAEQVRFHGREMTLAALMAEKRRFAQRWPDRSYEARDMRTACNGALATCIVRAQVAFHATSPVRGAVSSGLAEVVLEVSLAGPRPVIVSESSRVLRRGSGVSARATPGRNA